MIIVAILLLALLIGTLGFWDAMQAILGAVGVLILFVATLLAVIATASAIYLRRTRRRLMERSRWRDR